MHLEVRVRVRFDTDGEVDAMVAQELQQVGHVTGFHHELEAFMIAAEFPEDGGEKMLASGDGSADAQSALSPSIQLFEGIGDIVDGLHGALDAGEQLFARLVEDESFPDAIKQAAAQFGFEGFETMAEGGTSDMHLGGGMAETLAPGDGAK